MRGYVSYQDEDGNTIKGNFEVVEQTDTHIKIESGRNVLTIPMHKVNRVKIPREEK
jgi:hypothetical protein